jgi:2-polyprenyl-6-hydroxyphenyl methylase/3-demethylubiquinone-9 3-methyltransferase
VRLEIRGLRPTATGLFRWLALRQASNGRPLGRIVPTRSTAVLYQGRGRKEEITA